MLKIAKQNRMNSLLRSFYMKKLLLVLLLSSAGAVYCMDGDSAKAALAVGVSANVGGTVDAGPSNEQYFSELDDRWSVEEGTVFDDDWHESTDATAGGEEGSLNDDEGPSTPKIRGPEGTSWDVTIPCVLS